MAALESTTGPAAEVMPAVEVSDEGFTVLAEGTDPHYE